MKLLTLVVPCFNEYESLPLLLDKLQKVDKSVHFLVLDNGSQDGSREYLERISDQLDFNIKIFYIEKNNGYGDGILKGLQSIKQSRYIGWIHGDLQFDFLGLSQAIDYLNNSPSNTNLLFYKGFRTGRSYFDRFFSYFMGVCASIILGVKFREINAQPTIFSYELLSYATQAPSDFSFDTYIYWLALNNKFNLKRDYYKFPPREYGMSKWDFGLFSKISFSKNLLIYFLKLRNQNKNNQKNND